MRQTKRSARRTTHQDWYDMCHGTIGEQGGCAGQRTQVVGICMNRQAVVDAAIQS